MTQLVLGLARRGWSLRVYCGQPVYQDNEQAGVAAPHREVVEGVEVVRVGALGSGRQTLVSRAINWVSLLGGIAYHIWRDRHELNGLINTTNPSIIGVVALSAKWLLQLPFVTIVHDVYPDVVVRLGVLSPNAMITRLWTRLTETILRQSQGVVVLGDDMQTLIQQKVGQADVPIAVIPNWADPDAVRFVPFEHNLFAQRYNADRDFVVQYAGRMGRTHNLSVLLDAAALLQDRPIRFQLIGDGAQREQLAARVQSEQLHNVQFLPYQPFAQLAETLSTADLAIVTLDEAFTGVSVPSKTYNLMACGRPILGLLSPESEIGRTIENAACGIVLPNSTGQTIAKEIDMLLEDQPKRIEMGENGYRAFQKSYTLASAVQAYHECLDAWFPSATPTSRLYRLFQWMINLTFSLVGAVVLLGLIPIVWVANLLTAPGPVFYWQRRVGQHGVVYHMLKLRTMHVDAEAEGPQWAEEHDVRVTRIGRFLRKSHLDELPQLYNIVRGQMNLIGPRPERPEFTETLIEQFPTYEQRYVLKPGVTGWAQINQMYSASAAEAQLKLNYDLFYIKHRGWRLDWVILARTLRLMTTLRGR